MNAQLQYNYRLRMIMHAHACMHFKMLDSIYIPYSTEITPILLAILNQWA